MFTKLIGVATLFAAGSLVVGGSTTLGATPVQTFGAEAAFTQAGGCGAKDDGKDEAKAPAKAKADKANDGGCGNGTCGSKDVKKQKKEKKDGSCGKDKKEGSCGAEKK